MPEIIEINNLSFSYDDQIVLKDISLEVEKGDFLAFVGPNGSGKSTLMKLIIGDLKPDAGNIKLFGQAQQSFNDWSKIGYMSQKVRNFNQSFPATVKDVIAANLYHQMGFIKILNKKLENKIDESLKMVNMLPYKNRKIGNLSGGQQQRVFIARTLVIDPEVIILDEPMVGIDASSQDDFIKLINRVNIEHDITIIMVSHDIHVISSQANKLACFDDNTLHVHEHFEFDGDNDYNSSIYNRIIPLHTHEGSDNNA
ncbi:MAG: metal ABC transporter ATP-binding protein [Bacillota bacterium]